MRVLLFIISPPEILIMEWREFWGTFGECDRNPTLLRMSSVCDISKWTTLQMYIFIAVCVHHNGSTSELNVAHRYHSVGCEGEYSYLA
jgi:hypothetical protein